MPPELFSGPVNSPSKPGRSAAGRLSRRRRAACIAVTAVSAMVLAACTTAGEPGAEGGTFTIAIGVDLDTLDPAQQTTTTVQNVIDYALETLTELDKDGKTTPGLATEWETS